MGRRSKLTPERQARICEALRAGNTKAAAAAYGGIDISTYHRWVERGEAASSGAYRDFCDAVKEAEAACEIRNVALIQKAAQEHWTAAAWWLERRKPDDWARVERRRHEGHDGGPFSSRVDVRGTVGPDLSALSVDDLRELARILGGGGE
jgi:hypothetical protein